MPSADSQDFVRQIGGPPGDSPRWHLISESSSAEYPEGVWEKKCNPCNTVKTELHFPKDRKTGKHPHCNKCRGLTMSQAKPTPSPFRLQPEEQEKLFATMVLPNGLPQPHFGRVLSFEATPPSTDRLPDVGYDDQPSLFVD